MVECTCPEPVEGTQAGWSETADPDQALLRAMAEGDEEALAELYTRRGPGLLAYLIGRLGDPPTAEDTLQGVMLAAWKGARRFRGESRVRTWLLAIARYQAINVQRRRGLPDAPVGEDLIDQGAEPLEALERDAEREAVRRALHQLPVEQRETLELVFYHGLTGPEVATVLGIAPGTVKSRLHRAKARLRELLSAEGTIDA